MPGEDLAVAVLCGNYNAPDQNATPAALIEDVVLASLPGGPGGTVR